MTSIFQSVHFWKKIAWLLPLVLYLASLNPYFIPETYDNIIYHLGGVSLAETGSFLWLGKHNVTWAPGLSALLALPYWFGLTSPIVAKLVVMGCVFLSLILVRKFFTRQQREHVSLTCVMLALLPCAFMMGTRIMSEWPYIAISFLFLLSLDSLNMERRNLVFAVLVGCLLGAASLTRFVGVLLGASVLAQAFTRYRSSEPSDRFKSILPEAIVTMVGASIFFLWAMRNSWYKNHGMAAAESYYSGSWYFETFSNSSFQTVPEKISDLLFYTERILGASGMPGSIVTVLSLLIGLLAIAGMAIRLISVKRSPSDWYVVAVLILFAFQESNQQIRYLLPIAPFLISYLVSIIHIGAKAISGQNTRFPSVIFYGFCTLWFITVLLIDTHLVTRGNNRSHGGLSILASPSAEIFYRGEWNDLYRACKFIREDSTDGSIALIGGKSRYVVAFTGRNVVTFSRNQPTTYIIAEEGKTIPIDIEKNLGLRELKIIGSVRVYCRYTK